MRQCSMSPADINFRLALTNMRYRQCTDADVAFIRSLIVKSDSGRSILNSWDFRHVSIITGLNSHRDAINSAGCIKYAQDYGEKLSTFYSVDSVGEGDDVDTGRRKKGRKRWITGISNSLRQLLWDLPHYDSSNVPGTLHLCKGMPVIIKKNLATECGVTNGGEGVVIDWIAHNISEDKQTLDVVFVQLTNGSLNVQIEGLPPNVVPVCAEEDTVKCTLPDDSHMSIKRKQVYILPNFSMTDYASQGKTRRVNVVDLHNLHTHLAYYTALSRGAFAALTLILQGFAPSKVQGGITGDLMSEFRDIEILDDMTRMEHEGTLPATVTSDLRYTRISQFLRTQPLSYNPPLAHEAILWSPNYTQSLISRVSTSLPDIVDTDINISHKRPRKRPLSDANNSGTSNKRPRLVVTPNRDIDFVRGLRWDTNNWSCAYDSLLTVLYNASCSSNRNITQDLALANPLSAFVVAQFSQVRTGSVDFEISRDLLRSRLNAMHPLLFPYGQVGTSVHDLAGVLLNSTHHPWLACLSCSACGQTSPWSPNGFETLSLCAHRHLPCVQLRHVYVGRKFPAFTHIAGCLSHFNLDHTENFAVWRPIFGVETSFWCEILNVQKYKHSRLQITGCDWDLVGLVYHGGFHFVSRYLDDRGHVWFHDGMSNGGSCLLEGPL
ncbi:hypothetical protein AURDEDRAFT_21949, partial [Auricularia subglabra TFB-10046 SS5]